MRWAQAFQLLPLKLCDRLALGKRLRHRLASHFRELGLVIVCFQVRGPAGHGQKDDAFHPRLAVQRIDDAARLQVWVGSSFGWKHGGQRESAEAGHGAAQKGAAIGAKLEFIEEIHGGTRGSAARWRGLPTGYPHDWGESTLLSRERPRRTYRKEALSCLLRLALLLSGHRAISHRGSWCRRSMACTARAACRRRHVSSEYRARTSRPIRFDSTLPKNSARLHRRSSTRRSGRSSRRSLNTCAAMRPI